MQKETLEPILSKHPFLKGLQNAHLKTVVGCASNRRYDPGQFLFRQGADANEFYIIRSGKVAVQVYSPEAGPITVQTLGEGDILGWSWLIPPYQNRFDAKAVEMSQVIALDGKCLRGKCEANHELGYELLRRFSVIMSQRLEAARFQLLNIYNVKP